ncbi:MAG: diguanylate cyclase [Oscillospiraceae bacterium]|nr:diguanylate cyclase [Oscillospiraceae bacterium]
MSTVKPNEKKLSNITIILIVQLVVMAALIIGATKIISTYSRKNALDNMATIADERAQIVENFVNESEKTLSKFCHSAQVTDLLALDPEELKKLVDKEYPGYGSASPESKALLKAAQDYTVAFGEEIDDLEGVWIGTWDTLVMTQTNPAVVGMTTRKDPEALEQLRQALLDAGDGVYDTGIIISPASGLQIVSMYKAVYKNNKPVGLVGLGIKTEGLVNTLNNLKIRGINDSSYYMVNTADNKFIFIDDPSLVATEVTDGNIINVSNALREGTAERTDSFEFKDGNIKMLSTYSFMQNRGWVLMLNAPKSEVYRMTTNMRIFVVVFGLLILGLVVIFAIINARQEAVNRKLNKQILKTEKTKDSLSTAMFKDILTDVSNRVSLSMDLDKVQTGKEKPCYFAMFNIADFSIINTNYGNDTGDAILVNTAQTLSKAFPDGTVYRTGSDEFVVAVQKNEDTTVTYNQVYRQINDAHGELVKPQETPNGTLTVAYKIALVKKSVDLSTVVISTLKDMTNRSGKTPFGQVQFVDMDSMQ